ncbi:MAG: adenylyltransferase/cytidyltransferase family protein [Flavobacteriales bacterium]|nr:adenylyltransferase/cytidyltransferase family protein [Flavobacteriales bacterium]
MSKALNKLQSKIYTLDQLIDEVINWKDQNKKIVYTNGCFDLIHLGHVEVLARSSDLGDKLIVAINSDESIAKIKGTNRPIIEEESRVKQIAALDFVDAVILFQQDTPIKIISSITPNVITKGGDYKTSDIVGHEIIQGNNGEVAIIPLTQGYSTTSILDKIKNE